MNRFIKISSLVLVAAVFAFVLVTAFQFARPLYKIAFPHINESLYWLGGHDDDLSLDIQNGAKINEPNSHGETPLHFAGQWGRPESIGLLINNGADINAKDRLGISVLLQAANGAPLENFQILIKAGADVNAADNQGVSPLHRSVSLGISQKAQGKIITTLLNSGSNVRATTKTGDTPLHWAATSYYPHLTVQQLIDAGAQINTVNRRGMTAIHAAAEYGDASAVKILLAANADITIIDSQGKTAYDYALQNPQLNKHVHKLLKAK